MSASPQLRAISSAPASGDERPAVAGCPICKSRRLHYAFSIAGSSVRSLRVVRCAECRFMLLNPQPTDAELSQSAAGRSARSGAVRRQAVTMEHVALLRRYRGEAGGAMLVISGRLHECTTDAACNGFRVTVRNSDEIAEGPNGSVPFDVGVMTGTLERSRNPVALLRAMRARLKPDGTLLIVLPSFQLDPAGRSGLDAFRPDRLSYFDRGTLQHALYQAGFHEVIIQSTRGTHGRPGSMVVLTRPNPHAPATEPLLSVILPAFNEAGTVGPVIESLLAKQIAGMRMEVIIVESNSTDGTREVVSKYAHHPKVNLILEERPRGKGYAVRTGLAAARGDFILIQDADLEYDLEDYDVLLEPIAGGREALVLGSRHGGNAWWKMRQFESQRILSFALNCGHWFFTTLLNVLYGQRLKDPFTMYKVFRRDCLYGLEFRCNRFDFDHELLVRLVQKGYRPVEIPVNYRSRSFKEGKKVSAFRDPLTWIWALARMRFTPPDPLATIERARLSENQVLRSSSQRSIVRDAA